MKLILSGGKATNNIATFEAIISFVLFREQVRSFPRKTLSNKVKKVNSQICTVLLNYL
jgi:hypothetical protein